MNYKTTWVKFSVAGLLAIGTLIGSAWANVPAPVITSISPNSGPVGTSVTITGRDLAGATEVRFNGAIASFNVFGNQISASVPAGATTGPITVVTPGGTGVSSDLFTVTQTLPPVIASVSPASGPVGTQVIINGSNLAGATAVRFNGVDALFNIGFSGESINTTVPSGATSGNITVVTPAGISPGSFFEVTAAPPPAITDFSPDTGRAGDSVTINGFSLSGATSVRFNGISAAFTVFGGSIIATVPVGTSTGPVTITTPSGSDSSSGVFTVVTTPPPTITGFSPTTGPVGSSVTISGANLAGATAVKFNGLTATFNLFGNKIIARVPAGATTGAITVTTPSGTAASLATFFVGLASDLSIAVSTSADSVKPGDNLSYIIVVRNLGPTEGTNVTLIDSLPPGVDFFFALSNRGTCVESNHVVTCDLGTLASAEALTVKLLTIVSAGTLLTNTASVAATQFDPDMANNSTNVVTGASVAPPPAIDLSIRQISNNSLEISWPTTTASFVLEKTGSLASPASWTTVTGTPQVVGGKNLVSVNLTGVMQFYRLRGP